MVTTKDTDCAINSLHTENIKNKTRIHTSSFLNNLTAAL